MQMLRTQSRHGRPTFNLVFGSGGLIGSELTDQLARYRCLERQAMPLDWDQPRARAEGLTKVRQGLDRMLEKVEARDRRAVTDDGTDRPPRVNWLWAAGRCGFQATPQQTRGEADSFHDVLRTATAFARERPDTDPTFIMTSSAGGVYEGAGHVHRDQAPAPRRAYGELKLSQEAMLAACEAPLARQIYRLTSVYGRHRPGARRGLITAMLFNGVQNRVTPIFGRLDTLRDFTFTEDIARFIVRRIHESPPDHATEILAACRPTCIFEIRVCIEQILHRSIYVACSIKTTNDRNVTFAPDTQPEDWRTEPLEQNVRRILHDAMKRGTLAMTA